MVVGVVYGMGETGNETRIYASISDKKRKRFITRRVYFAGQVGHLCKYNAKHYI